MNDTELDERLAATIAPLSEDLRRRAVELADTVATSPSRQPRSPRPVWFIPLVVVGAIALTAGTTFTAATMSKWPWVSMPEGNIRNTVPIPAGWTPATSPDGRAIVEHCEAWIELRNGDAADERTLDAAISTHDWTSLDREWPSDGNDDQNQTLDAVLHEFVTDVFPGIQWMSDGVTSNADPDRAIDDGRLGVDALGESCLPDQP